MQRSSLKEDDHAPNPSPTLCLAALVLLLSASLLRADDVEKRAVQAIKKLGGKVVTRDKSVVGVNFRGTQVTDAGLKELAGRKQLQRLDLFNTQVTDAGLKELAGRKQLQSLYLGYTEVTDAGVAELQKALPQCRIDR